MRKINLIYILVALSVFTYCNKSYDPVEEAFKCNSENNPINLIFKYGVTAKNILNTFDCTYQKDMILDPPVITNLKLTEEELDSIFVIMQSIEFFKYPDTFYIDVQNDTIGVITPSSKYYFFVENDSIWKELSWNDSIINPDASAEKLRHLNNYIIDIIESKEEYKVLPEPRGGYL